jgi:threonine dehydratase
LKDHDSTIQVFGCQPLASPVMARSVEAGEIIDMQSEATLSDGTAGGIEEDALTFPVNQAVVDDWVLVKEEQIATAMNLYMECEEDVVEGAAGVAVAGLLERRNEIAGKTVVVVICGGNISEETLRKVRRNSS